MYLLGTFYIKSYSIHSKKMKQAIQFWNWFEENSIRFFVCEDNSSELFRELKSRLELIDRNLTYEISVPRENGKREMAISADGRVNSFQSVIEMMKFAPKKNLSKWEIVAFRQKDPKASVIKLNNGFKIDLENLKFNYSHEEDSNQISLRIYCESPKKNEKFYNIGIPVLLDGLLGEYDAVTKIKHLNLLEMESRYDIEKFEMKELPKIIDKLKQDN